jgi:hypothetical protein
MPFPLFEIRRCYVTVSTSLSSDGKYGIKINKKLFTIHIIKSMTAFNFQPINFEVKLLKYKTLSTITLKSINIFVSCEDYKRL